MSYYGISVLITILATSLIAFYLLYKARQLNLGILISISIGSVFLGFTFKPVYNSILELLSANINAKIALVISILAVLVIFLFLILILSYITSISIPKKIASIDCCAIIDKVLSGAKIKASFTRLGNSIRNILDNIPVLITKTKKYVYSLQNKLKKPVDTKQIIDTMGIEKIEEVLIPQTDEIESTVMDSTEQVTEDIVSEDIISQVIDFQEMEPQELQSEFPVLEDGNSNIATSEIDEIAEEVDVPETQDSEKLEMDFDNQDSNTYFDLLNEEVAAASENEQFVKQEEVPAAIEADNIDNIDEIDSIDNTANAEYINSIDDVETSNAEAYILKAFESKDQGKKEEAIDYYFKALELEPHDDMIFWIALDICTLYKQLGMSDLATIILEGLVDQYGSIIQPEIKVEIINNLKHS